MPAQAPEAPVTHEYSTRRRKQHKNTNTAEAPDSEQKAPAMQHKACSPAWRGRWRFINWEGLLTEGFGRPNFNNRGV